MLAVRVPRAVTQTKEQRRLQRIAHRMNQRAVKYGAGEITAGDLAYVVVRSNTCHYCGIGLEVGQGSFDHSQPLHRQGRNDPSNIVRCCFTCNRKKFTKTPEELDNFKHVIVECPIDGTRFRPRYAEWVAGRAKYCSRSCAARSKYTKRRASA